VGLALTRFSRNLAFCIGNPNEFYGISLASSIDGFDYIYDLFAKRASYSGIT
jgi:hypothetical protein